MRIPYGISNFADLRRNGYVFADKSGLIPNLEDAEKGLGEAEQQTQIMPCVSRARAGTLLVLDL